MYVHLVCWTNFTKQSLWFSRTARSTLSEVILLRKKEKNMKKYIKLCELTKTSPLLFWMLMQMIWEELAQMKINFLWLCPGKRCENTLSAFNRFHFYLFACLIQTHGPYHNGNQITQLNIKMVSHKKHIIE